MLKKKFDEIELTAAGGLVQWCRAFFAMRAYALPFAFAADASENAPMRRSLS